MFFPTSKQIREAISRNDEVAHFFVFEGQAFLISFMDETIKRPEEQQHPTKQQREKGTLNCCLVLASLFIPFNRHNRQNTSKAIREFVSFHVACLLFLFFLLKLFFLFFGPSGNKSAQEKRERERRGKNKELVFWASL